MKNIRVITVGILFSWVVLQLIYVPFTEYFLNSSRLYAFSIALETSVATFHPLTVFVLITSMWMLSLSIGMFLAIFIYHPIEILFGKCNKGRVCRKVLKVNSLTSSALDT